MLVGALIATGTVLLLTRDEREYVVTAYLQPDTTEEQKAEVESALGALEPVGEIEFQTSEQAWQEFQEMFKDRPELIDNASPEAMPESFRLTTTDPDFTCSRLDPIRDLAGVEQLQVLQKPNDEVLAAAVSCY
jgi:cell division protein FtsX